MSTEAHAEVTEPQSIASVTVAYNAANQLPRQIEALRRQTRPLQEIIVVDNASTDATSALLAKRYPQVTVLKMPENLGAAGAWSAGLSYAALEKRHDLVWTFDDDSLPDDDALQALLDGLERLSTMYPEIGIVAPLPVDRKTGSPYPPYLWREGFVKAPEEVLRQSVWLADVVIVSGSLVRRGMVQAIGLPRADFFMDVFDFEYCLRAESHGYKIGVINGARLVHEVGNIRQVRLPGYARRWSDQAPWREYYISRNLAYLAWRLYPTRATKRYMARYLLIHALQVLLFSSKKLACLGKILQGFSDGLRATLGIRFRPS